MPGIHRHAFASKFECSKPRYDLYVGSTMMSTRLDHHQCLRTKQALSQLYAKVMMSLPHVLIYAHRLHGESNPIIQLRYSAIRYVIGLIDRPVNEFGEWRAVCILAACTMLQGLPFNNEMYSSVASDLGEDSAYVKAILLMPMFAPSDLGSCENMELTVRSNTAGLFDIYRKSYCMSLVAPEFYERMYKIQEYQELRHHGVEPNQGVVHNRVVAFYQTEYLAALCVLYTDQRAFKIVEHGAWKNAAQFSEPEAASESMEDGDASATGPQPRPTVTLPAAKCQRTK